ncbi:maltase-glucoamylase-like [Mytilus trossulus]|uniref:maltase-glucoamylase-like n=1 Tax=Mytilus trossulus TaxID=6551 RepID=UPI00300439E3
MSKNCSRKRIGIICLVIAVFAAILVPVAYEATRKDKRKDTESKNNDGGINTPQAPEKQTQRIDCFPENVGLTEDKCKERNCIYDKSVTVSGVPSCFFPANKDYGFSAEKGSTNTPLGYKVNLQQKGNSPFESSSPRFKEPTFEVQFLSENLARFKLYDKANARYEVPVPLDVPKTRAEASKINYEVNIVNRDDFAFEIKRRTTGTVIFDSRVGGLTLTNQFLQISTQLPSTNVYGFGENIHKSFKHDLNYKTWPMFSRDQAPGWTEMANLYGVHPFYTCVENGVGNTHGVFFLNSNAQEYSLTPLPMLTYRTIGGILDVYIFLGPSPENVIQQYTELIGRPFMPPYWALGFQLCRYGYTNLKDIETAVENTKKYNIPHDVQYADIDHMDKQMDFTIDQEKFGGLNTYFKQLQAEGMHTIIILDPCFTTNTSGYEPYDRLKAISGAVMWPQELQGVEDYKDGDGAMLGYVWPEGKVVFPDFFKNQTKELWIDLIVKHRQNLTFDAIWIDMNEPANFGTNEDKPWNWPKNATYEWSLKCPQSNYDDPPYKTKAAYVFGEKAKISDKTLCMVARQGHNNDLLQYNVHSLYGWSQSLSTLQATRKATGKRSMVLSRSTFPGSGKYIGHWLGDNDSKWSHLRESIIGMLEFNLFGIPYIGADICGFFGNTEPQLCKRWMQLGAFYPFSRNHNGIGNIPQDPGVFGEEVANASRIALEDRYWLLPYLYTLFHRAHVDGHTVARPVHHEFPNDSKALSIDEQFLWGSSLLISPILYENQTELSYYYPAGRWYDLHTGWYTDGPTPVKMPVGPDTNIQLDVRGGSILPMQEPARNTTYSRKNPLHISVALDNDDDKGGQAEGELFWDDGDSIDTYENGNYYLARFKAVGNKVWSEKLSGSDDEVENLIVDTIKVYGVQTNVSIVTDLDNLKPINTFTYDSHKKVLTVTGFNRKLKDWFSISWTRESTDVENTRIDCYPERLGNVDLVTKEKCESRHCIYDPTNSLSPDCYFPSNMGYKLAGSYETELGMDYNLTWEGLSPFGNPIRNAIFRVEMRENNVLRFKLFDAEKERYEVPIKLDVSNDRTMHPWYELKVVSEDPFHFQVLRIDMPPKKVIYDTTVGGLIFEDQFLQIATKLPSDKVYGFGENVHGSLRHDLNWKTWPMFARDQPTGDQNFQNHYGVHPFYTYYDDEGTAYGILIVNSNSQEYSFTPLPMLIYRTIGGVLDFYLFIGLTPEGVVYDYTKAIGLPFMPPYWSLGFQLCRYGYNNITNLKTAVDRTIAAKIPLDIQYADIDHMDERKDFTVDDVNFSGLNNYFKSLQAAGMRTITILDPALITNVTGYEPYDLMNQNDANIKWPENYNIPANSSNEKGALLGYVWPKGKVVFPDFFKNVTKDVWKQLIVKHHNNTLSYDGLWIDMNEPANFDTDKDRIWNWPVDDKPYWSLKCNKGDKYEDPPYRTMAAYLYDDRKSNFKNRISDKTICMVATQGEKDRFRHYDVHNLYGLSQTPPTLDALQAATGKQGIVISRSTFPGSGKYSGHWLGDNSAVWQDMKLSIIGILEFNMFGIPYIGADICGFFGNTTPELCKRWMQLGAFYTFSRNHNGLGNIEQDPGALGEDVARAARQAIETRYWLLPYLHSLFYAAHTGFANFGSTVIRSLHNEFEDKETFDIDEQFMWGPALMISPILREGQTNLRYYLPQSTWYDWYTGIEVNYTDSNYYEMNVLPDSPIPLHIRGGFVLPLQEPANNTHFSRKNPITLKVALTSDQYFTYASGNLYWDDGEGKDNYESGNYFYGVFACRNGMLNMDVFQNQTTGTHDVDIDHIEILGIDKNWDKVYIYVNGKEHSQQYVNYTKESHIVRITNLKLPMHNSFYVQWKNEKIPEEDVSLRIDCFPDIDKSKSLDINTQECKRRGCIWAPVVESLSVPFCYINTSIYGYTQTSESSHGISTAIDLKWQNKSQMFQDDIESIRMIVTKHSNKLLQVKIIDPSDERYEVPVNFNKIPAPNREGTDYNIQYGNDDHGIFSFNVTRKSNGAVIWDTSVGGLTFADQFLQFVTKLPSKNVYGFGENRHKKFRHNFDYDRWPMFSRDNGVNGGDHANLYGVHPFYMCVEDDGNAHGVLLLNSNAMEIVLQPHPTLAYRTTGGILDFYLFLGPTPEDVVRDYTSVLIGKPYMPPYWALGFQLCKYGYNNIETLKEATERTIDAGIPFDVQYADIDHMDERKDFTIDSVNFGGLPDYVKELQGRGMHFIIILDPALITNNTGYKPYEKGLQYDIFIKWPDNTHPDFSEYNNTNMLGYVWPKGKVVFPDFLNNKTHEYWKQLIINHHKNISFDGLWIDMNEPANFDTDKERPFNWPESAKPYWSLKCPESKLDDPPYKPRGIYGARLSDKTLCMVALQNDGKYRHYNVHSLYGWSQTKPTLDGLRQAVGGNKRGMVISRSTYPSSGKYTGHWLGDNNSEWPDLHYSIIGIMEFNLFGIPYIGADICGFFGDSNADLCQRWMQLGAFYTFSRNHNTINTKPQDPAYFGKAVAASSRKVLEIRYYLLPYLYHLFFEAHSQGGTVIRSIVHNFPSDKLTWDIDTQFMWGTSLMFAPVLRPKQVYVEVYFPESRWYDYYNGKEITPVKMKHVIFAPKHIIPIFIRGGSIIHTQTPANTTVFSRKLGMGLLVALNENGTATGKQYWDDGESIDAYENGEYFTSDATVKNKVLSFNVRHNGTSVINELSFDHVVVYGLEKKPTTLLINDVDYSQIDNGFGGIKLFYREKYKLLNITMLNLPLRFDFTITWS